MKPLNEIIMQNLLAERMMAIQSENLERLKYLDAEIEKLKLALSGKVNEEVKK